MRKNMPGLKMKTRPSAAQKRRGVNRTPLSSLSRPLSEADGRRYAREFGLLQANILKSHGRESAVYIFLTFNRRKGSVNKARAFIRRFAGRVTSAAEQAAQSRRFAKSRTTELLTGLYLTAQGYRFLGLDTTGFSPEFRSGLKRAGKRLVDPPVHNWDEEFQPDIHALVLFAHDSFSELVKELLKLRDETKDFASVTSEFGFTMRNLDQNPIEHFGYVDGASQPIFFDKDLPERKRRWNPAAGPNLVLVKDPHGRSHAECGTYVVFRKLEQNVRGFKEREESLAKLLGHVGQKEELVGAMIVGRFENGTAVPLKHQEVGVRQVHNDFTYKGDGQGNKCPLFAHIRKANLRDSANERARRIARRGITYGDPTPPGDDRRTWPERGVGLLFHCCQADLRDQFESLHRRINDYDLPTPGTGQDPLIGQSGITRISFPADWNSPKRVPCSFGEFVRMRGGEYFFAPSISVLKRI